MVIDLWRLRTLQTVGPAEEGRPSHVAAASGLVHHRGALYVVADDEQSLACFPEGLSPGHWIQLLPGELPLDPDLRKSVKADFETLTWLPPFEGAPDGALLAIGSGSHPRRGWGAVMLLDPQGKPSQGAIRIDLRPLYDSLGESLGTVNIEGAVVVDGALVLLQRGNQAQGALVRLSLAGVQAALAAREQWTVPLVTGLRPVSLPSLLGVPLGFTDGVACAGERILFVAAAEQTQDPYLDGPCAGSAIGVMSLEGEILSVDPVDLPVKLEGVELVGGRLWLVSDQDDPALPAQLFEAEPPPAAR
ncbi:MAG: hypothetical protein M3Y59_09860 [Myxococcota bacterium]|nr:hypothetical protein [Myxococcota bacterium]